MNRGRAEQILNHYRDGRTHLHQAVTTLRQLGDTQASIAGRSGLTEAGVRKIIRRETERRGGQDTDR